MILSMFLSNQNHWHTYLYNLFTFFWQMWYIHFLQRQYWNFNCYTYKYLYVIETLSWINGYFLSARCNLCTLYNHIQVKIYSHQRQQGKFNGFVDLNFITGRLQMAYILPCLCFSFFFISPCSAVWVIDKIPVIKCYLCFKAKKINKL